MKVVEVKKVRALVLKNGKILITKAKKSGAFILPGGKIEKGEEPKDTICREVLEETGIELSADEIMDSFYTETLEYESADEQGKQIYKKVITEFYIVNTTKEMDYRKMNLTPREKARESYPYWINPSILEYNLINQKEQCKSAYAIRYAKEFLNMYRKFIEYNKNQQKESNQR